MEYSVDIQGFKQPLSRSDNDQDDYVAKELAIIPLAGDREPVVILFKPPFPWKRFQDKYRDQNAWLERYYHGLSWKSGTMEYMYIGSVLREHLSDSSTVFVRGKIQKQWLQRFKFNVVDIAEIGLPLINKKLVTVCPHHNGSFKTTCALHNAKLIKLYINEYSKLLDAVDGLTINRGSAHKN